MSASRQPILAVRDLTVRFGGIVALDGVSFDVAEGQVVGLIGPNGAGKTTLFNCLSRLYTPQRGDVRFRDRSLLALPPHRIADLGIGRTFQNLALFPTLTVLQNVMIGVHSRTRSDFLSNALRLPWVGREEAEIRERARELLAFLDLTAVAAHPAAGLPFGAYSVAQTLVQVLKQCGNDLSRENIMKQAASLKNLELPLLLPGIKINTSATDFAPIEQEQLARFDGERWVLFGELYDAAKK